jgi:hypothetical protein
LHYLEWSALPGIRCGGMALYEGDGMASIKREGTERPMRANCRACVSGVGEAGVDHS